MIFLIPLVLFASTLLFRSNKTAEFFWLSLVFCTVYYLAPKQKINKVFSKKIHPSFIKIFKSVFIVTSFLFLLRAMFSDTYFLGGDDSRLFYLYPSQYIQNFVLDITTNIGPGSAANILPPVSILPFMSIILMIKTLLPFINIQSFLYTLNLVLGLVFFYKFISYSTNEKENHDPYIKLAFIIVSFMFVFSIFNAYILFNAKLLSIYLVSTFPLCLYLFIKSVREAKKFYLFIIAIIATIFSFFAVMLPWAAGLLIVVLPIIFGVLWEHKKRLLTYSLILSFILAIFNLYWLVFIPSTSIMFGSSSLTSGVFRMENAEGIRSTALLNRVFYPLLNLFHYNIQANFNWAFLVIFKNWYLKILPLNFIFFFTITLGLLVVRKTNTFYKYYLGTLVSFILAIYFYTVHFGMLNSSSWGVDIFTWLNTYIPGFVIFRNMYDKFAPAMAFVYSLMFGISLVVVLTRTKSPKVKNLILFVVGSIVLLNAKPVLLNEFDNIPVWTTRNIYAKMSGLDPDYLDAAKYVSKLEANSGILTLPLAYGNVSIIKDSSSDNNFYLGVSPMLFLSGKNDYPGIMSFDVNQQRLRDLIFEKDYPAVQHLFQEYSIDYVLVLNQVPEELQNSYLFYPELFELQNQDFKDQILGEEIISFGSRYTLYEFKK